MTMILINNRIAGAIAGGIAAEQAGGSLERIPADEHAVLDVMQEFRHDSTEFFVDTWESTLIMKCALDAGVQHRFHDCASLDIDKLMFHAFRTALTEVDSPKLDRTQEILTDPKIKGTVAFIEIVNTFKTVTDVIRQHGHDFTGGLGDLVEIEPDEPLTHWIYGSIKGYHLGLTGIPKHVVKLIPLETLETINEWTSWFTGINPESDQGGSEYVNRFMLE